MLKLGMDFKDEKFSVVIPATIEKSEEGDWRVFGLASTPKRDLQGEVVSLKGLDLSPIEKGRGVFNFDHKKGPENTIGAIDQYKKTAEGLYLGGYLFKEHDRAKSIYQIMTSLKKSDKGRMGMSIEGIIKKRAGDDGKTISNAVITSCALTMNPVNEDTFVNLMKSLTTVEFSSGDLSEDVDNQIVTSEKPEIEKALGVTGAYATSVPADLSGGDALAQEDLDKEPKDVSEPKRKKKLKKMSKEMYKSATMEILVQLQSLYPDCSRSELWEIVKDRLNRRFLDNKES